VEFLNVQVAFLQHIFPFRPIPSFFPLDLCWLAVHCGFPVLRPQDFLRSYHPRSAVPFCPSLPVGHRLFFSCRHFNPWFCLGPCFSRTIVGPRNFFLVFLVTFRNFPFLPLRQPAVPAYPSSVGPHALGFFVSLVFPDLVYVDTFDLLPIRFSVQAFPPVLSSSLVPPR